MGKLELREGATPPGEEALNLEMRFTDDGGGGHLPQRPGGWGALLPAACVVRVGRESEESQPDLGTHSLSSHTWARLAPLPQPSPVDDGVVKHANWSKTLGPHCSLLDNRVFGLLWVLDTSENAEKAMANCWTQERAQTCIGPQKPRVP